MPKLLLRSDSNSMSATLPVTEYLENLGLQPQRKDRPLPTSVFPAHMGPEAQHPALLLVDSPAKAATSIGHT